MHHLLEQQTKRFLHKDAPLPQGWDMFLAAVDDAYSTADADRQGLEHSLELMSKELAGLRADLAERQLAEAQLEHLLSLLGAILESTTDGMLALDRNGRIVRFNQRFVEMWNIPDEIMAFWEHQKVVEHVLNQLKDPGSLREKIAYLQLHPEMESNDILECMDGRIIERYSLPQPIGVDSVGRILSFRDITERKRAEEALRREQEEQKALIQKLETAHNQLLQSEKMASIGQLAAGVAHEINNPIGYVNSNLGSLAQYVEKLIGCARPAQGVCRGDSAGEADRAGSQGFFPRRSGGVAICRFAQGDRQHPQYRPQRNQVQRRSGQGIRRHPAGGVRGLTGQPGLHEHADQCLTRHRR